ncbi:putative dipeptidase PepE [invertebrate metagenome]|uniref:Putative dipeptidase PepE n=1 Tax=invertebrate metagenome TaxID=1711999 RepID=A0A2H9T937_9ZZZZ
MIMSTIPERLHALRVAMSEQHIDVWIIPSADAHESEYVADHWKGRTWMSGFTGSAGTLVLLHEKAALWTDGRYFLQAEQELQESNIELMRDGEAGVPSIHRWLIENLSPECTIGFDGNVLSKSKSRAMIQSLNALSPSLKHTEDLLDTVWTDRPAMPAEPVFLHDDALAGKTREEKLIQTRKAVKDAGGNQLLITTLDDIAWLMNLRGTDIECNPVFLAYAMISEDKTDLFINQNRIEPQALTALKTSGIEFHDYNEIISYLTRLPADCQLIADPDTTSTALFDAIPHNVTIIEKSSPTRLLKAVKNATEIKSMEACHRRDGVAMVRFMHWLSSAVSTGTHTECSIAEKLEDFRKESTEYKGPSFTTISGYEANGAIVHYSPEPSTCATVQPRSLLLVDSGGQYPDGTTDITRTFACGELTDEERRDYTMVMKSHINLATARFKKGVRGLQLDVLARQPLWQQGMDFNHGTGHGVGYFLNVHEGPQSISPRWIDTPLEPGMLVTNEPGVYRSEKHGIRLENIMLVQEDSQTEFGDFYCLCPMTLAPFDTRPLMADMLNTAEKTWLNHYQKRVFNELAPLLSDDDTQWLKKATKAI